MRTVAARDINRDGILELPRPSLLPAYAKENAESFWSVLWQQYDLQGSPIRVFNTYFNDSEGWYLILPDAWDGVITLAKSNIVSGERATTFYLSLIHICGSFGMFFQYHCPDSGQRTIEVMEPHGSHSIHIDFCVGHQFRKFFVGHHLAQQTLSLIHI